MNLGCLVLDDLDLQDVELDDMNLGCLDLDDVEPQDLKLDG